MEPLEDIMSSSVTASVDVGGTLLITESTACVCLHAEALSQGFCERLTSPDDVVSLLVASSPSLVLPVSGFLSFVSVRCIVSFPIGNAIMKIRVCTSSVFLFLLLLWFNSLSCTWLNLLQRFRLPALCVGHQTQIVRQPLRRWHWNQAQSMSRNIDRSLDLASFPMEPLDDITLSSSPTTPRPLASVKLMLMVVFPPGATLFGSALRPMFEGSPTLSTCPVKCDTFHTFSFKTYVIDGLKQRSCRSLVELILRTFDVVGRLSCSFFWSDKRTNSLLRRC